MPNILALETSSNACSVALATPSGVFEDTVILPREHTQRLLPMIDGLLTSQQIGLNDLNAIAYGAGPGSFTGLRICLSVAQGLAYGADLPLIAVSSLLALAKTTQRIQSIATGSIIIPAIDARMNEVYWCAYEVAVDGSLTALLEEQVTAPQDCADYSDTLAGVKSLTAIGSGWQYPSLASRLSHADLEAYANAYDVAILGQCEWAAGHLLTPAEATPTYLRNEVSWKKRERIRTHD